MLKFKPSSEIKVYFVQIISLGKTYFYFTKMLEFLYFVNILRKLYDFPYTVYTVLKCRRFKISYVNANS